MFYFVVCNVCVYAPSRTLDARRARICLTSLRRRRRYNCCGRCRLHIHSHFHHETQHKHTNQQYIYHHTCAILARAFWLNLRVGAMAAPGELFPLDLSAPKSEKTGGAKRRAANALPKVFLVCSGRPRRVIGALQGVRAVSVSEPADAVYLLVGGVCLLAEPLALERAHAQYLGVVFGLRGEFEARARLGASLNGGTLNYNFLAHAASSWRCWAVSDSIAQSLQGPRPPTAIGVDSKCLASIGVQPEFVHSLADVLPDPDGGPTEGAAVGEPEPASASAGPGSVASGPHDSTSVFADAARAAQRLGSIARPLSGGAVTHNYDARTMITALQFSQDLKPGVSLQVALRHAAPFFLIARPAQWWTRCVTQRSPKNPGCVTPESGWTFLPSGGTENVASPPRTGGTSTPTARPSWVGTG
jgi:hypothetical protein